LQIGLPTGEKFSAASDQFAHHGKRQHSEVTTVLRTSLFLILTSVAMLGGTEAAVAQTQVTDDPQAAAPVQYDNGNGNNGSATMMDCGLDDNGRPLPCQNDSQYLADDQMDEPDVDSAFAPDYYAYQDYEYYPPYYAGVSLWPYGGYWPGYGCCGWGFGWPVYGFGIDIGFGFGFGRHHGFGHGFAGHDHFHGPWRYDGHGHFWDNHAAFAHNGSFNGRDSRGFAGRSTANFGANRSMNNERGFSRGINNAQSTSFRGNETRGATFGANRAPLRSASYYSANRGVSNTQAFNRGNFNTNARGNTAVQNSRATGNGLNSNPRVTSMPSRGYASQSYRSTNGPNRTYTGTVQRGGSMGPQQRYNGSVSRGGNYTNYSGGRSPSYSGGRSASYGHPSYSGRSYSAPRGESHSSSGGHSSGGHEGGGHESGGHSH
jgi:hypothetical protein